MELYDKYKKKVTSPSGFLVRSILSGISFKEFNKEYGKCSKSEYLEQLEYAKGKPRAWRCTDKRKEEIINHHTMTTPHCPHCEIELGWDTISAMFLCDSCEYVEEPDLGFDPADLYE